MTMCFRWNRHGRIKFIEFNFIDFLEFNFLKITNMFVISMKRNWIQENMITSYKLLGNDVLSLIIWLVFLLLRKLWIREEKGKKNFQRKKELFFSRRYWEVYQSLVWIRNLVEHLQQQEQRSWWKGKSIKKVAQVPKKTSGVF